MRMARTGPTPMRWRRQVVLSLALGLLPLRAVGQYELKPWTGPKRLPALQGTDLQGRAWNLIDLKGKAVLVNFWATWCAPCKEEMPTLQTLFELAEPDLVVLAVNVREPLPRVRRYLQSTGLTLPVLPDPKGDLARAWGISVYPSSLLIDSRGAVRQVVTGAVDWSGAEAQRWLRALQGAP